jgi:FkbM family methyltransferase
MIKEIFRKIALQAHIQHEVLYSQYKMRAIGVNVDYPLTPEERGFYLNIAPALGGKQLVVYDIGAARGVTSCCLAKLKNVKAVHAFEPMKSSYQNLVQSISRFDKVFCHNIGLGNIEERKNININNLTNSSSLFSPTELFQNEIPGVSTIDTESIDVCKLDSYVKQKSLQLPQVIKIDVQGYEKEVILGGIETVRQAHYCFMEMSFCSLYENTPLFDELYQLMVGINFRLVGVSSPMTGKSGQQLQVDGLFMNRFS